MILLRNVNYMFTVFTKDDRYYMTVVVGGVGMYDLTVQVTQQEVEDFRRDPNKAIVLAKDVATRTAAYADRLIDPSIDPS